MNEPISFNCRKLKRATLIHSCYSMNGMIYIKNIEQSKPQNIHHIKSLCELFSSVSFLDEEGELLRVASHDVADTSNTSDAV